MQILALSTSEVHIMKTERREADETLYQSIRIPFGVKNGVANFQHILDSIIKAENIQGIFTYLSGVTMRTNLE